MGGASQVIAASTIEELQQKVEEWYDEAGDMGLVDARIPWDPGAARKTDEGFEYMVWAHS